MRIFYLTNIEEYRQKLFCEILNVFLEEDNIDFKDILKRVFDPLSLKYLTTPEEIVYWIFTQVFSQNKKEKSRKLIIKIISKLGMSHFFVLPSWIAFPENRDNIKILRIKEGELSSDFGEELVDSLTRRYKKIQKLTNPTSDYSHVVLIEDKKLYSSIMNYIRSIKNKKRKQRAQEILERFVKHEEF